MWGKERNNNNVAGFFVNVQQGTRRGAQHETATTERDTPANIQISAKGVGAGSDLLIESNTKSSLNDVKPTATCAESLTNGCFMLHCAGAKAE